MRGRQLLDRFDSGANRELRMWGFRSPGLTDLVNDRLLPPFAITGPHVVRVCGRTARAVPEICGFLFGILTPTSFANRFTLRSVYTHHPSPPDTPPEE